MKLFRLMALRHQRTTKASHRITQDPKSHYPLKKRCAASTCNLTRCVWHCNAFKPISSTTSAGPIKKREDMMGRLNAGLITRLLPVLDDLVMALGHVPEAPEGRAWADGMGLINRKLHTILESEGASVIEAEGSEFDPSQHESLGFQESTSHPEGQVVSVVRSGYTLNGRVLRQAQVIVARNPEPQQ